MLLIALLVPIYKKKITSDHSASILYGCIDGFKIDQHKIDSISDFMNNSKIESLHNNKYYFFHSVKIYKKISDNFFLTKFPEALFFSKCDFNFIERFDSKLIFINNKNWILEEVNKVDQKNIENKKIKEIEFITTIDMNELKNLFTNVNTVSFLEIFNNIKILNNRGYSGDELKIKFHKYLSLPLYLLAMIILSTLFTLNINKNYNNFIYIFLGIIMGIIIYFLNDLSIAIGLSNKIPLELSVWIPIFLIIVISLLNLLKSNEKYY